MKMKTVLFTVIALFLLIGGIGCEKENGKENVTDIYHTWKFQGFGNVSNSSFEKADPPASEQFYILTFGKDGILSGSTTTNGMYGEYIVNAKNVQLKILSSTERAEKGNGYKYSIALLLIESYEIAKNKLKLYYNQGQDYLLYNLSN